jgi:hypothetical protein
MAVGTNTPWDEIGTLQRRKIEAGVIAPIYQEMAAQLGTEAAKEILGAAISKAAIAAGKDFASRTPGGTSLKSFEELQVLWTKDDALKTDVLVSTENQYDYNVTRCRYAETYKEMGLAEIGHLLSSNRDGVFCQGYDDRIRLQRTQTIMGGADHCDFRYTFDER